MGDNIMKQNFYPISANQVIDLNQVESIEVCKNNKEFTVALYSNRNLSYIVRQEYQASVLRQLGYKIERDEEDGSPILSVITSDW
jgi:hypothetical protein